METIDLLIEEHNNIKRMLKVMRKLAIKILETKKVEVKAFYEAIDFVRNYADKHHHGKEEDILFEKMVKELEEEIEDKPIGAMLSEHDLGRYFINNLETALKKVEKGEENTKVDVIANAVAYTDLLDGHIYKEDNIVYSYAQKELNQESLAKVKKETEKIEQEAKEQNIQEKYINLIDKLEEKVEGIKLEKDF